MYNLQIIKAVYCPLSDQLHSISLCEQLCDNYYEGCTEGKLIRSCVMCPAINRLMSVGSCADECNYYEGDGKDIDYVECSYE